MQDNKMTFFAQKKREKVGSFAKNMFLCSANNSKQPQMLHINAPFYSYWYFYFTPTR